MSSADINIGDEYTVTWNDGETVRYRCDDLRKGGYIITRRWMPDKNDWTPWQGIQVAKEIARFDVRKIK
jgi:hypothetical protein